MKQAAVAPLLLLLLLLPHLCAAQFCANTTMCEGRACLGFSCCVFAENTALSDGA